MNLKPISTLAIIFAISPLAQAGGIQRQVCRSQLDPEVAVCVDWPQMTLRENRHRSIQTYTREYLHHLASGSTQVHTTASGHAAFHNGSTAVLMLADGTVFRLDCEELSHGRCRGLPEFSSEF